MTYSAYITGTGGTVQLDGDPYLMDPLGIQPGTRTWKKYRAESPFVHGAFTIHATMENVQSEVTVWVFRPVGSAVWSYAAPLVRAFEARDFRIYQTVNGESMGWRGEYAEHRPNLSRTAFDGRAIEWKFTFERHPIPVSGGVY